MSAAEALAAEISEPLTWAEICARHPDDETRDAIRYRR